MRGWALVVGVVILVYVGVNAFVSMRTRPQIPGANSPQSNDAVALQETWSKDWLKLLIDYADILETVQDERSTREAARKIEALVPRINAIAERQAALPKVSKLDSDRIKQMFLKEMAPLEKRLRVLGPQAGEKADGEATFMKAIENFL